MIEEYWIVGVAGSSVCVDLDQAIKLIETLNSLPLVNRFKLHRLIDIHTNAINHVQYAAINYIVESTVASRKSIKEHEKMLEKENIEYD